MTADFLSPIERALERWEAFGLPLTPVGDDQWVGPCPVHRADRTVSVVEGAGLDAPVTIEPCGSGCFPDEIARILGLTAYESPQWLTEAKQRLNGRRYGTPEGAVDAYMRVIAACTAQGLDGRRSDVGGVKGTGRYQCPVCGAPGDGHGMRVSIGTKGQPVVLTCDNCKAPLDELLEALGLTRDDIRRPVEDPGVFEPDSDEAPPADETVLDDVERFLARFVAYPSEHARVAHTLWVAHTHMMDAWDSTPRIAFLSPEPGSGKTRALEATELLVPNPVEAVNVTPAYLFRKVGECSPTILYDEIDTVFGAKAPDNEGIRGLLNAGHRRGAVAGRCVTHGKIVKTEEIPAYCAVALAGLGGLPDTLLSRAVVVRMRRRAPGEQVEPFRRRLHIGAGHELRDRLATWACDAVTLVTDSWGDGGPEIPPGVEDRDADIWEALLAIADVAGEQWPTRARAAAVALVTESKQSSASLGVLLLADLRTVFDQSDLTAMFTRDMLSELHGMDESPWFALPLDARGLARRLGEYGITSKTVRIGDDTSKGYHRHEFEDAWRRYCPIQLCANTYPPGVYGEGDSPPSPSPQGSVTSVTPSHCSTCGAPLTDTGSIERGTCFTCYGRSLRE